MLAYDKVSANGAKSNLRCAKKSDGSQDARTRLSILSLLVLIKQWLICLYLYIVVGRDNHGNMCNKWGDWVSGVDWIPITQYPCYDCYD